MFRQLSRRRVVLVLSVLGLAVLLTACSGGNSAGQSGDELKLAPVSELPQEIQQADPKVVEAYRFAIANPDYLAQFPCYCGCGGMGHQSNTDCYIREVRPDGSIAFETHAFF